jgi:2'-5' RNA ligase
VDTKKSNKNQSRKDMDKSRNGGKEGDFTLVLFVFLLAVLCIPQVSSLHISPASSSSSSSVCTTYSNCDASCADDQVDTDLITWFGESNSRFLQFQNSMVEAEKLIRKRDSSAVSSTDGRPILHMTLAYLCCLDPEDLLNLEKSLQTFSWNPVNVSFSHVICNNDSIDHNSFILLADEDSQQRLSSFVIELEAHLVSFGVPILKTRTEMEPFHSTLGVVKNSYPIPEVLQLINSNITQWTPNPIFIESFFTYLPPGVWYPTINTSTN